MFKVQKDQFNTGFQITFENGWTVSVQFGRGNYCSNRTEWNPISASDRILFQSEDAEVAAWDENGIWYRFENDTVKGYCKPDEVADFIAKVKAYV
jgi:hypothetical protein